MVAAIYVLNNNGIPILSVTDPLHRKATSTSKDDTYLFSGILSAIMSFMEEIKAGKLRKFNTELKTIHLYRNKEFSIAVITDMNDSTEEAVIETLFSKIETEIFFFLNKAKGEISLIPESEYEKLEQKIISIINEVKSKEDEEAVRRIKESLW
ncbi:MAG: hypothetical protein D6732_18795 [Methanobacteriota archaeon]|nr:MAG: hypothetical protein D6732_18795 [Euryarchaeota archaeon]